MMIYKIVCDINNKVYIGQTSQSLVKRFNNHMGYDKYNNTKFTRAIREYGRSNFSICQIDYSDNQDELDDKEVEWMMFYNSVNEGYNMKITKGRCGGDTLSHHPNIIAIGQKIRESKLGDRNPMRINGGLRGDRNGMFGKRGKDTPSARACIAISEDGEDIIEFDTLTDLQRYFNVTTLAMVSMRCRNKTKTSYNGYYFQYYEECEESLSTIESDMVFKYGM